MSSFPDLKTASDIIETPPSSSEIEMIHDYSISVLSDPPSNVLLGRGFSLMVEILDKALLKAEMPSPVTFQALLVDKNSGQEGVILGEIESTGTALFRKLVVNQEVKAARLVVRVKEREDIAVFSKSIRVKMRKSDSLIKKAKSTEIEA